MHDNTPPRVPDIQSDDVEEVYLDDEDELEELDGFSEVSTNEFIEAAFGNADDEMEDDENTLTFKGHSSLVFGCALHPTLDLAATGGEDDKMFVWNTKTGETQTVIETHKDTVTEVHFNHDGNLLASGDMSGELLVHRFTEQEQLQKIWEFSMGDMTWLRWHPNANVLLAGSEAGDVYVWRIPSGECKILPTPGARCDMGAVSHDGKKLYTAYTNGMLRLWDLKQCTVLMEVGQQHPSAHEEGVLAVDCDKNAPLYMSGGSDGKIIFCTNSGPVANVTASAAVECVAISPCSELKLAASGTLDGEVAIWDTAKFCLRTTCQDKPGCITKLKWLNDYFVLAATNEGEVLCYDARDGSCKFAVGGHFGDVYDMVYLQREHILLTVSEDHTAKVHKLPKLEE